MRSFTQYQKDFATLTGNASTTANTPNSYDNISWGIRLINDAIRYLATVFYFNETSYTVPGGTVATQAGYNLPADFEQLLNVTVNIGGLLWQPKESPSRAHFDALNVVPYNNDYPQYWFIYNGKLNLYPTPATSGNVMVINYKKRVTDLAMADVDNTTNTTTVAVTTNTTNVTASGATFKLWMGMSGWIQFPYSSTDANNGDNKWYQIASITSTTALVLKNPYMGATITAGNFTIGDVPILPEDYQDLPLFRTCRTYFSTRVSDATKAGNFKTMYDEGYILLDNKYGQKSNSPVLTDTEAVVYNPNLFPRNVG
jgi:hypothetical protein